MAEGMSTGAEEALSRLISLIDDLDAVVPESSKALLDDLDRVHDDLDASVRALEARAAEGGAGGLMNQVRAS